LLFWADILKRKIVWKYNKPVDMKRAFLVLASFSVLALYSCGGGGGADIVEIPDTVITGTGSKMAELGHEVIEDLVQNVSSPIEMAALIKRVGVPFSRDYLSDPNIVDKYATAFDKAINLGVLGADLGYMNIYNRPGLIFNHITSIKKVAEDLRIGQFFDFNTLRRLASNNENLDSLMYISTSSFNRMDRYLRENNRSNASALMVTGVWIEGLYLATQVAKRTDNLEIRERIGEQKISLNDLLIVLKVYQNDTNFARLIQDFEELKLAFDPIKISVERGEPTMKEVDGMLLIVQNDIQHLDIPDGQIEKIIDTVERIRNRIVNPNA
jgi:hypothetical protein